MNLFLSLIVAVIWQLTFTLTALCQDGVAIGKTPPVSLNIQRITVQGVDFIQVEIRNNLPSQVMIDRESLLSPGVTIQKDIERADGTQEKMFWGYATIIAGAPSREEILRDSKRIESILPGNMTTLQLKPEQLLALMPSEMRGDKISISLELRDLILSVAGDAPAPEISRTVFRSNVVDLPLRNH